MQIARIRLPYPKNGPKVRILIRGLIEILHLGNRGGDILMWVLIEEEDLIADRIHLWMFKETEKMNKEEYYEEQLQYLETIQMRMFNMKPPWFQERQSVLHIFIPEEEKRFWARFGENHVEGRESEEDTRCLSNKVDVGKE